jgi:integrase
MKKIVDRYIQDMPDGKFHVDVRNGRGQRIRRTFLKKEEARAVVRKALLHREEEGQIKSGTKRRRRLIMDAIDEYAELKSNLRPSSVKRYRPIFRWLRDFVSDQRLKFLDEFTPHHAITIRRLLLQPRLDPKGTTNRILTAQPQTINIYLRLYRSIFAQEVAMQYITYSPMSQIKNLPVEQEPVEFYSDEELAAFFGLEMPEQIRYAFRGLFYTGFRFDELAHLRWADVNFEKRYVAVRPHDTFKPKTKSSIRNLPMSPAFHAMLVQMAAAPRSDTYVFVSSAGVQLKEQRLLETCKKLARAAGIKRATLHLWRHTMASHLAMRGVPIEMLKTFLGHSSIRQTERYMHLRPEGRHADISAIDLPSVQKVSKTDPRKADQGE